MWPIIYIFAIIMQSNKHFWYHLIALIVALIWGETFINSKILILHGMSPSEIFVVRFLLAYICIWFISPKRLFCRNWKDELRMMGLGITGGSLYFVSENMAVGLTYVNNVSFIVSTAPLITTLFALAIYREFKAGWQLIAGSILALAGVGLVIFNGQVVLRLNPVGDLLALASSVSWAVYSLFIRKVSKNYNAAFLTRKVFFYGLVTMLPVFAVDPWQFPLRDFLKPEIYVNALFLGIVASFLCFALWSWVIDKLGALKTTNYTYLNPLTTIVASAIFLDEPMTTIAYIGSGMILAGVILANLQKNMV